MNFLAHVYLSGSFDNLMIGNFMADFVKGRPPATIHPVIIKGIELHRHIDTFTDTHPVVRESKLRLQPKYRKYAGVIVDMYYDHFLAVHWHHYSHVSLTDFASQTYQWLNSNKHLLPAAMHQLLYYMQHQNWLVSYAETDGIARALEGMSHRTTFKSDMELAVYDLKKDYALYQKEFTTFFPVLIEFVQQWKETHI
jgi:acyl carrier protein phosphodiesterase